MTLTLLITAELAWRTETLDAVSHVAEFELHENTTLKGFYELAAGESHTLLAITIAHIESFTNVRNENYKVNFDLKVEPEAISSFGKQLQRIAKEPIGKTEAVLKNAI